MMTEPSPIQPRTTSLGGLVAIGGVASFVGPDTESRKSADGFVAALMLTKKPKAFVREWVDTPESRKVPVETTREVHVGEHVAALVFLWDCHPASMVAMRSWTSS
jgi:hypothetical protein